MKITKAVRSFCFLLASLFVILSGTVTATIVFGEDNQDQFHDNHGTGFDAFSSSIINDSELLESSSLDVTEPETSDIETIGVETTEPETTEPETTEPETTEPETTDPETTVPETTEPESTEPETTEPETTEPESTEPETTEPETTEPETLEPEIPDEPQPLPEIVIPDEKKLRVGISYGTSVTIGYSISATNGFYLGTQLLSGSNYSFSYLWTLPNANITMLPIANVKMAKSDYSLAKKGESSLVGGYSVVLKRSFASTVALNRWISEKNTLLSAAGVYAFPAYINGQLQLRIGTYADDEAAAVAVSKIMPYFRGYAFSISSPSNTGITVIDSKTGIVLFQYDNSDTNVALGTYPIFSEGNEIFTKVTSTNLIYRGVFCFKRYIASSTNGITAINVLPIDEYVKGVLPYEVSSSWNIEALKANAIAIRTYTYTQLNKHQSAYGFDLCNTSNCQVYRGMKSVTESVERAVTSTKDLVVYYGEKLANCYYAASFGGVSCSAADVWGGKEYPYLIAQLTPWENYMVYSRSFWISEISAVKLAQDLQDNGYLTIKDEIADIRIDEYCKNSTYVKTVTFIDIYGNEVQITGPSRIRSLLTGTLNSANFVVGKNEVKYTIGVFLPGKEPVYDEVLGTVQENCDGRSVHAITADEEPILAMDRYSVMTADGVSPLGKEHLILRMRTDLDESVYLTAQAENENSFVFVGKGWGHGVGLSQYGSKDLADAGRSSNDILLAYFPGTTVKAFGK